ncbi:fibronectin type III domain-containing protein [Streptomyces sp. BI20]|uniref:phage tail tube protein n=1 Tax=Streptomyces sp. BI20 TaxID=3403460 RepID=UPI003C781093
MASSPSTPSATQGHTGNAKKIRFAPQGQIYVADASAVSALPRDCQPLALNSEFKALGYVDEGGVTITPSIQTDPVNVWQSAVPVLYNVKSASFQIKATLMETSELTTQLFFGAKWVEAKDDQDQVIDGVWRLDLKSTPDLTEIAIVVDWSQTSNGKEIHYRCVVGRAMISDRGAIQLQRAESGKFELTIDALDNSGSLGYVLTDDSIKDNPNPNSATVTLQPASIVQGGHFVIAGAGFKTGEQVKASFDKDDAKFTRASSVVDKDGQFTINVDSDPTIPVDTYTVSVTQGSDAPIAAVDKLTVTAKSSTLTKLAKPVIDKTPVIKSDEVDLTWPAVPNADTYVVSDGTTDKNVTTNSADVTGLTVDTAYSFTVKAQGSGYADSDESAPVAAHTLKGVLAKPTGADKDAVTKTSATVKWTSVTHAESYVVTEKDAKVQPKTVQKPTVQADFTGLTAGTDYKFTVVAKAADYEDSPKSDVVDITTPTT